MLNLSVHKTARRGKGRPAHVVLMATLACAMACLSAPSWALYKVVGPDGKITYTDRPPTEGKAVTLKANGSAIPTDSLPYELQKIVARFPVTLYTSKDCSICDAGRSMLTQRGIPFRELTVDTREDSQELRRLESAQAVPVLRIGGQRLNGFNETDWTSYLDVAGYPKQSLLPASYRMPAATPLVPPKTESEADGSRDRSNKSPRNTPPPAQEGDTPAIRF